MDFSVLLRRTRTRHRDAPVPFQSVTSIRVGIFLLAKRAFFLAFPEQNPSCFESSRESVGFKVETDPRICGKDEEGCISHL